MQVFEKIKHLLNKPEIRLLSSSNSNFVLSFLYYEFKQNERDKIAKRDLFYDLRYFISELPDKNSGYQDAKFYIKEWQTNEKPFLKTLYFDQDENDWIIQPTIHTKHVFQWIESLQKENVISSEVGFLSILDTIKNLVFGTIENPDEKLETLKNKREKIDEQIKKLENIKLKDEKVELPGTYLIQDTYRKIVSDAEKLIFDFEMVAEKYDNLKEEIKDKFNIEKLGRGLILGSFLTEEEKLHENKTVKSYTEFRKYLRPEHKDELDLLIQKIHNLEDIQPIEDKFLKNLTNNLWQASLKIGDIDDEIFAWLKNVFDKNYQEKIKRTYGLIQEIKKSVIENKQSFPDKKMLIKINGKPEIYSHKEYTEPKKTIKFAKKIIKKHTNRIPENEKEKFANSFYFNIDKLKQNISKLLKTKQQISLKEIIEVYPITKGLTEIIAYTMLASEGENEINRNEKQTITCENELTISVPLIIFKK